jgi:hypothetical protein
MKIAQTEIVGGKRYIGVIHGSKVYEIYWGGDEGILRQDIDLNMLHPAFIQEAEDYQLHRAIAGIFGEDL